MLRNPQLIDQHSTIGFLKRPIMGCRRYGAVKIEVRQYNCLGIPSVKRLTEFAQASLYLGQIILIPPHRGEMAYHRLKNIHGLIVIDDVNELHRSYLCASIRFELH